MKNGTQTISAKDVKSGVDLRDIVGRYVELRRESSAENHGPCPWCGGTDRFIVTACNFFCRPGAGHCGRKGDAIDFVMAMNNVSFREACAMLDGSVMATPSNKVQPARKERQAPVWDEAKQVEQLERDQTALLLATDAQEYLLGRGLDRETWAAFGLGYRSKLSLPGTWNADQGEFSYPQQPAIAMPWYRDGHLVAVRYRFLKGHFYTDADGKERKGQADKGVKAKGYGPANGNVFGLQALPEFCGQPSDNGRYIEGRRTLVICEGEINAMSIWQVAHETNLDVLSIGSESSGLPDWLTEQAQRYGVVIVYVDRQEVAHKLQMAIPGAFAVTSEMCGGADANDLLQAGHLGGYLSVWRYQAVRGDSERVRKLANDLWIAADMGKLDAGSEVVLTRIEQGM